MDVMEQLVALCKRRGFVYPSAELYGGVSALWDYGPYGVALKHNIKEWWWRRFVLERDDVVGLETTLLTKREVLQASGHEAEFADPLVECKICHQRFRSDQEIPKTNDHEHSLTEAKQFNLMFQTNLGPVVDHESIAYLRPETAQGMFTNFKTALETTRKKVPFGIAQAGKSFRNEITTGNFIFRSREFEIAEIEFFVRPGTDDEWFDSWVHQWQEFFIDLGLSPEKLRKQVHTKESLAHYSKATTDFQYHFPFGWEELSGVANRTDYDLGRHERYSNKDLKYFDEETKQKYLPYVIEPTLGVDRLMLAVLVEAFDEIKSDNQSTNKQENQKTEFVLRLHPRLAPVKAAVFPLVNKDGMPELAQEIYTELRKHWQVEYDSGGTVGRRYRRQDEIGTPWCITVDGQTKEDGTVTIRDRDTMEQQRIKSNELYGWFNEKLL